MQIAKHKVVTIDYTLSDGEGTLLDSSHGGEPLAYIHGMGNIIPGLEKALEGKRPGEQLKVTIAPEEAYGPRNEALEQVVPRNLFEGVDELEVGMRFQSSTEEGVHVVTIVGIEGDDVTVDSNHPLAGVTLNFDVTVRDIRDATPDEVNHGHVHGAGGHHH